MTDTLLRWLDPVYWWSVMVDSLRMVACIRRAGKGAIWSFGLQGLVSQEDLNTWLLTEHPLFDDLCPLDYFALNGHQKAIDIVEKAENKPELFDTLFVTI